MSRARLVQAGNTVILEDSCDPQGAHYSYELALVMVFDDPEDLRAALRDGRCEFTFGTGEQP